VDRNRLKGITYEKAVAENIETAKLPLDECIKMMGNSKTKVLTVNHVFEILLKFAESSSWVNAFQTTLPERKDVVVISNEEKKAKEDAIKKTDDSTTTVMKESAMEENSADVADVADGKD
jgi:tRNA (guanine9-N1)-methyltransferase